MFTLHPISGSDQFNVTDIEPKKGPQAGGRSMIFICLAQPDLDPDILSFSDY